MTDQSQQRRKIAILSVGRSDFGRYLPVIRAMESDQDIDLRFLAGGSHFDPRFGNSIEEVRQSGVAWVDGLGVTVQDDSGKAVGMAIAEGTRKLSAHFAEDRPDLLVLLGDRYEMLAGASAAIGFNIPIFHLHGGAVTEGAIDELVRHALTKMSHCHLVSCEPYADRVRQMGEEDWRVFNTGAPGLDGIEDVARLSRGDMTEMVGFDLLADYYLVCFHPVTLENHQLRSQIDNLMDALADLDGNLVVTYPNSDKGHDAIIEAITQFQAANAERCTLIKNAGSELFLSLLRHTKAIIGNSSSGIVEAATFKTPAINIGTRQDGKVKPDQVIDCGYEAENICAAIESIGRPAYQARLAGLKNPYGDGKAGKRIASILKTLPLDERLMRKRFVTTPRRLN